MKMRWKEEGRRTVGKNRLSTALQWWLRECGFSICICLVFSGGDKLRASNPVIDLQSHFCILASETGSG